MYYLNSISMQICIRLTHAISFTKMMQITYCWIRPLSSCINLVNQVVILKIYAVITNPEYTTLPWCFEKNWSRLKWVIWIVGLLGIIPAMPLNRQGMCFSKGSVKLAACDLASSTLKIGSFCQSSY